MTLSIIGGFSDRVADTILRALIGRFGGDSEADDTLNIGEIPASNINLSLQSLVDNFKVPNGLIPGKNSGVY